MSNPISYPPTQENYLASAKELEILTGADIGTLGCDRLNKAFLKNVLTFNRDAFLEVMTELAGLDRRRSEAFTTGALLGLLLSEQTHESAAANGSIVAEDYIDKARAYGVLPGGSYVEDKNERTRKILVDIGGRGLELIGKDAAGILKKITGRIEFNNVEFNNLYAHDAQLIMMRAIGFVTFLGHEIHTDLHRAQENEKITEFCGDPGFDKALEDWLNPEEK